MACVGIREVKGCLTPALQIVLPKLLHLFEIIHVIALFVEAVSATLEQVVAC